MAVLSATVLHGGTLRVCADPNNLPFSNQQQQGFENKLAGMLAHDLGDSLSYAWWSERGSLVKNTLQAGRCDVLLGVPVAFEGVATTDPYYRSTYVFVTRPGLHIASLSDPRLRQLRIGIHVTGNDYAPPAVALAHEGIVSNVRGYSLFGEYGSPSPGGSIVHALETGDIDVAIVWGPLGGFVAKQSKTPLQITPVLPRAYMGVPFTYQMALAVRPGDEALRQQLNAALSRNAAAIQRLLQVYGVPEAP